MSHTSKSSFSSTSDWVTQGTSYRVVHNYQAFGQTGWNVIPLDTPFEYNGTDNLLITVDDNSGSWVSSKTAFYAYSTGANRAHYTFQDNTDFNPASISANSSNNSLLTSNSRIQLTKEVPSTQGYLSVSPTSLSGFEAVSHNLASEPQSFAVIGSNLQANLSVTAPTGFEVSTASNGSYNSTLTLNPSNGSLSANVFVRLGSNVNPGSYSGNLTLTSGSTTASVSLSGNAIQGTGSYFTITAAPNNNAWGTVSGGGTFAEGTTATLTASANEGYAFINWTKDGTVVSPNESFSFTVTEDASFVANFSQIETVSFSLNNGWNWWATNIDITLAEFENALQGNGIKIIDQAGNYVEYDSELGWSSNNNLVLEVGKMYMVQMARNFTANLNGFVVNPADHQITLNSGTNWVGFIGTQEMTLNQAFAGFTPNNLDNIKTQEGSSTYYNSRGWVGRVTSLVPGQGFIYKSKASSTQTFYYPAQ